MDKKEIHPLRNFIDKKTANTLKTQFHREVKNMNDEKGKWRWVLVYLGISLVLFAVFSIYVTIN